MPKRKSPEETCVICMCKPKNKAGLDCCQHEFCRKCIIKWSETENSCPLCKRKFTEVKTAKSTKKIKNKRQRPDHHRSDGESDGESVIEEGRELFVQLVVKYITDDAFKLYLASQFLKDDPPRDIVLMANCIRHGLCSAAFSHWVDRDAPRHAREEYYCARHCIETMFGSAPGSHDNPISIAI